MSSEPRQRCTKHWQWSCRVPGAGQSQRTESVRAGWGVHANMKVMLFPSNGLHLTHSWSDSCPVGVALCGCASPAQAGGAVGLQPGRQVSGGAASAPAFYLSQTQQICYFDKHPSKHQKGITCVLGAALFPSDQVTGDVRGSAVKQSVALESRFGFWSELWVHHALAKG